MTGTDESRHDHVRTSLGAYVLSMLPAAEAAEVEQHVAGCAACRREVDELAPTGALLGELRRSPAPALDPLPVDLGDRVAQAVAGEASASRRPSVRSALLAAVAGAAAAVVLVVGLSVVGTDDADEVPFEAVSVSVSRPALDAAADLVDHTWGLEVKLSGSGFADGRRFRVDVLGADGRRYPAGEFVGTGDRPMLCNLSSAVLRADATGFEVRDHRGRVVARSRFA